MAWRVVVALLAGLLACPAPSVLAQGFLPQFAGPAPPPRLYGYPTFPSNRSLYSWPSPRPFSFPPAERCDDAAYGGSGGYRTLCVRLCDGFYFPISGATTGSGLSRDADACNASCGTEARLFYYPNAGGGIDSMVDLTGLAYSGLPNAFRYRKTLVPECRCRPQPWADAELQRHRAYAGSQSAVTDVGREAPQPARTSSTPPSDAPSAVDRPEPILRDAASDPWPSGGTGSGRPARSRHTWPSAR